MKYFLIFVLFTLPFAVGAQTAEQDNDGDWSDPLNWVGNNIGDDLSESVEIAQNVSSDILNGESFTIGFLTLNKSVLTIETGGELIIGSPTQTGFFQSMNNATLIIFGDFTLYGNFVVNNDLTLVIVGDFRIIGDIEVKNGARFDVSGDMVVEGDFVAGTNTTFNVDGAIEVQGDLTIGGNGGASGPFLTYGPDGIFTVGGACNGPGAFCSQLPVELIAFTANSYDAAVVLRWSTASELNNDYFTVQVSLDGIEFRDIAKIEGSGTVNREMNYSITDTAPVAGKSYYRLTQTDFDRSTVALGTILVDRTHLRQPMVYPNPMRAGTSLNVYAGGSSADAVEITVHTLQGHTIHRETYIGPQHELPFTASLPSGIYVIQMNNGVTRQSYRLVIR